MRITPLITWMDDNPAGGIPVLFFIAFFSQQDLVPFLDPLFPKYISFLQDPGSERITYDFPTSRQHGVTSRLILLYEHRKYYLFFRTNRTDRSGDMLALDKFRPPDLPDSPPEITRRVGGTLPDTTLYGLCETISLKPQPWLFDRYRDPRPFQLISPR
jgi:hypothetical protein